MNPELKATMSSTSGTAERCFAGRVATDDLFVKDIDLFDACGSSQCFDDRSFDKQPASPFTCKKSISSFRADSPDSFSFLDVLDKCLQTNMQAHIGLRDFILLSCDSCHSHRTVWNTVFQRFDALSPTTVAMDGFSAPIPEAEEEDQVFKTHP